MAGLDKVKMTIAGSTFEATGNINVVEIQRPRWVVNGGGNFIAAADRLTGSNASLGGQAYVGTGSKVRFWRVDFTQWEGSTDSWGSASADDDVLTKINILGNKLATSTIDSGNTATLAYGEYSTNGQFSPLDVVPGEIELPADLEERPSSFRPRVEWYEAMDGTAGLMPAP
jgi:hypothetical protein